MKLLETPQKLSTDFSIGSMYFENENVSQLSDQYQIDISLNKLKRLLQSSNGLVKHL
jgi:hypothetical protein